MFNFGGRASPQTKRDSQTPKKPNLLATPPQVAHYGQIIEYVQNRIYLAAYTHPPTADTPFPYPRTPSHSPTKRSSKPSRPEPQGIPGPSIHPPCYFTIDNELIYNRFYADFGPLHIGHVYRFAVEINLLLAEPSNEDRALVLWSKPDSRSRANAACLLACYMILVQGWSPHLALAPIAQAEPPVMPFRDAGYSQADFSLSIQDVLYGVWRAKQEKLCSLDGFNIRDYERFERVDQGDFNWLTADFVALASPQHELIDSLPADSELYADLPSTRAAVKGNRNISEPFKNVLNHFTKRNVGVIVRLNSQLYSPSYFNALGINHLDMIFDDGTCPPLSMVKRFIRLAHDMITVKRRAVAVHCKAGLGRTGCLIGAYFIYRHGFTANEVIAFMRFMRPGMVVGPQQHWLHLNQNQFREWWFEDKMKAKLAAYLPATPAKSARRNHISNGQTNPPPTQSNQSSRRSALGEITHNENAVSSSVVDENLPAPTPGQPRKGSRIDSRHQPYTRANSCAFPGEAVREDPNDQLVEMNAHRQTAGQKPGESKDEWEYRAVTCRTSSHSPTNSNKKRSVSYTTSTTTTATHSTVHEEDAVDSLTSDVENWTHHEDRSSDRVSRPKSTSMITKSGSGSGSLGVAKIRGSPVRRSAESREVKNGGVRKTSARVASVGTQSRTKA
ncbi:uncharacterized protein KY384_008257 [Bacidia gigantensis]|uniref:uncharacterized protein n=1 Tax=Bacidia gigantensis TaxID=2732470 RepID=UPI001D04809F|nr:uncharacterized protein KY384_008257 [Bacidia gigantensis]KAG8526828.1 hypothetical protein KY384_008257 [Bacidia gigantensis]